MSLSFTSLGGAGTVTGSRHLLEADLGRILVDCGLFQGLKFLRERNWSPFPIDPKSIDAVVLTHAHLDHSGYLPKFVREGFTGPIYCSEATADLCEILLRDSAHIAEKDADYANRKGFSKHRPARPLYTMEDAGRALRQLRPIAFKTPTKLAAGASVTLHHAGHILGAAIAELHWQNRTLVFSGDLGRYDDPFMPDPTPPPEADYVIVESTYGNRTHDKTDPMDALGKIIERTVHRGGTVVIPAFAVGRAQIILYHLWMLKRAGRLQNVPVFLDSPMAINATELLCRHMDDHRFTPEACQGSCSVATYTREVEESKAITASRMPKVVISASGMATGGRILHHLRTFGADRKSTILFTGYQASGTRGAKILGGGREVRIFGQWVELHAEIASLPALSAHADSDEIMRWLRGARRPPKRTFIVHGEHEASEALRVRVDRELSWACSVVDERRRYELGDD